MFYQEEEKFLTCGKAAIFKEKNGSYTVKIGKSRIRFNKKKADKVKALPKECDVIVVGISSNGFLYGWDIKQEGVLHIMRYSLYRGVYRGTSGGKASIQINGRVTHLKRCALVNGAAEVKVGSTYTFVCKRTFRTVCKRGSCLQKSPSACQRCGGLKWETVNRELIEMWQ